MFHIAVQQPVVTLPAPVDFCVSRRVPVEPAVAVTLLAAIRCAAGPRLHLPGGGWLELADPPSAAPLLRNVWTSAGRVRSEGRLAVPIRVVLEVSGWSSSESVVSIRPVARNPMGWGRRRTTSYFDQAHRAADHLWLLTRPAPDSRPAAGELVALGS